MLGTRKRKTSRQLISDTGSLIPASRIHRYFYGKFRNRLGIGVLMGGPTGSDHFMMSLQRTGPWLSFTKLRIDVVIENQASRISSILPGSEMKRRFWIRRRILIEVPNDLVGIAGAWYRIRWYAGRRPYEQRHSVPSPADLAALRQATP